MEKLFDHNDLAKYPKLVSNCEDMEEVNIGIEAQPKIIKLSRNLPPKVRHKYIALMKEHADFCAWSYKISRLTTPT